MGSLPRIPALDAWLIDGTVKGYPGSAPPTRLGDLGDRRWNVLFDDVPLPAAVLKASSLEQNRGWMRRYLAATGAVLCPHGKTTMSPQLFQAQLEDGAFGITCATVSQLQVYRRFGINRVLMANQVVGRRAVAYVIDELERDPTFELYLLVDSVEGVDRLATAAAAAGLARPLRLLLEVGLAGARTGVRDLAGAEAVISAVESAGRWAHLHGVEVFEDVVEGSPAERERAIESLLAFQLEASSRGRRSTAAAMPWLLSAGGSSYFDLAAERLGGAADTQTLIVLRSGCYLTHDHGIYGDAQRARIARSSAVRTVGDGFRPALEIWTHVQSRPEAARAYLTAGKRDVSYDRDLPRPIAWFRPGLHSTPQALDGQYSIVRLNDQHAHLRVPDDSPLAFGDLVGLGISHPCTTFDKWQLLYVVDDDYTVVDGVRTFF